MTRIGVESVSRSTETGATGADLDSKGGVNDGRARLGAVDSTGFTPGRNDSTDPSASSAEISDARFSAFPMRSARFIFVSRSRRSVSP